VKVAWHPQALAEAEAAAAFYRERQSVLALRFLSNLDEALDRISLNPRIYREVDPGVRKCRMKAFPYAIVYRCDKTIEILAVMHLRRQPGFWRDRR
jgi:toxin ParE1/3/4